MSSVRKGCYGFRKVALRDGEVVDVSNEGSVDSVGARKAFVPALEANKDNNNNLVHVGSFTPDKEEGLQDSSIYLMNNESE